MDNQIKRAKIEAKIKEHFEKSVALRAKADGYAHCDATRIGDILAEAAEHESKAFCLMTL